MNAVACPIALHPDGATRRIAVFEHPRAGMQLVKGYIRPSEQPAAVAARALYEQSGLETRAALPIGSTANNQSDEIWHFALCRIVPPVRDRWQHLCVDDSGHLFKFAWMPLDTPPPQEFDERDLRALDWIRATL